MERDIVYFDLESTGVKIATDRIVQIAMVKEFMDGRPNEIKNVLVNPTIRIPQEATDVHGITNEMVREKPKFEAYAKAIWEFMKGCDIGGYNQIRFDIPLIVEEFLRVGITPDFTQVKMIDGFVAYRNMTPRTLAAAHLVLTGEKFEDAHDAEADILATVRVIKKIQELDMKGFAVGEERWEEDLFAVDGEIVDYAGKFGKDENGFIIYQFGKHKGEIVKAKDSFLIWMKKGDFTKDTLGWVKKLQGGLNTPTIK